MRVTENDDRLPLILIGASARAAVHSARRSGVRAKGLDLFGDIDSYPASEPITRSQFPRGFVDKIRSIPNAGWMDAGGLENDPATLLELSSHGRYLGSPPESIAAARNPRRLHQLIESQGWPSAWLFDVDREIDHSLILKPSRGSAGIGVRQVTFGRGSKHDAKAYQSAVDWLESGHQIQRKIEGTLLSAIFLAAPASTRLIGLTRQLVGLPEINAPRFRYCGSIGPIQTPSNRRSRLAVLGERMANELQLRGLFGIDLIDDGNQFWVLEVNPRYTAAVEVLERADNRRLIAEHLACFDAPHVKHTTSQQANSHDSDDHGHMSRTDGDHLHRDPDSTVHDPDANAISAKCIVYSRRGAVLETDERFIDYAAKVNQGREEVEIADIPRGGTIIGPREPCFTVLIDSKEAITQTSLRCKVLDKAAEHARHFRHLATSLQHAPGP